MVFCATITRLETGVAATREVRAIAAATRSASVNGTGISSNKIALPGCKDRCGNLSIPYPFGMDSPDCYRDPQFEITCNYSNGPPVASISLSGTIYEVLEVTLDYVRINRPVIALCDYDRVNYTTRLEELVYLWTELLDFSESGTSFTISNTLNKLIILGCNIYGSISPADDSSRYGNQKIDVTSSGCASHCTNGYIGIPSPCVGNGCCKATIPNPNGLAGFKTQVERMVGRQTDSDVPYTTLPPCKCSKGYRGNPYLQHGCQDVNECKESHECGSGLLCTNTPGSYNCDCAPGEKLGISSLGYHCMPDKRKLQVAALVASDVVVSVVVILMLGIGYWLYKSLEKRKQMKLKQKHFERNGGLLLKQKAAKIFVTEELMKTTDNFNPDRIIGKGGFGTVFKGMLPDGEIVAIKKSTLVDEKQVDQFINEVALLSQINHRHIVKLLGCCLETHVPLLVYEFVPNGTLSYHLQDRVRIASEIAGALAYLHADASVPIFHRDIKSSNILLDENYKAKVSDFGISRSIPIDATHLTTLVQGTFGYLDPEYYYSSQFTDKSDVYSFGIVLVELLTGEKAISETRHGEEKSLRLHFIRSMKENLLFEMLDARVFNEAEKDDVLIVAKAAKRCLKYVGKKRPTMKEVSLCLGGLHEKLSRNSLQY
ncbi:hypothetical protein MKX03_006103 [Papaver bracteatum]|nr:hypothetical protein MKX03_006103 [Papaver bracteatum]